MEEAIKTSEKCFHINFLYGFCDKKVLLLETNILINNVGTWYYSFGTTQQVHWNCGDYRLVRSLHASRSVDSSGWGEVPWLGVHNSMQM